MHQQKLDYALESELQWGRNFIVAEITPTIEEWVTITELQWGRNFIVAETVMFVRSAPWTYQLQWGRNFIVAETRRGYHRPLRLYYASMGPQLYRCGNGPSSRANSNN